LAAPIVLLGAYKKRSELDTTWGHHVNKSDFGASGRSQQNGARRQYTDSTQYLLRAEQQILQLISARAPVAKILDEICYALDRHIGNIVSVVSLPDEDFLGAAEIVQNATLFGLYAFFSAGIASDSGQQFGTLDMYSCLPRRPLPWQLQLVGRAVCLAAIAIGCRTEARDHDHYRDHGDRLMWRFVPEQPAQLN
jgi:hypothetical protein